MKKILALAFGLTVFGLTACVMPEKEDPFARLPEESLETIEGKLYPFSVSVSTRATHRLEQDSKLVGYLASDLVQLAEFEGQQVELKGVWRNEKMRQIFWVESIKVPALEPEAVEETPAHQRFSTKRFTLLLPSEWEYTVSPNDTIYFIKKDDPNRRVFLTFAVQDYEVEAERIQPNISMNGFNGIKESTTDESGKEREVITFFSNLDAKKYVFTANYAFDDFDTKKQVLDVLQSFVEGEDAVQAVIVAEQKAKAELEAAKLAAAQAAQTETNEAAETEDQNQAGAESDSTREKARDLLEGIFEYGAEKEGSEVANETESERVINTASQPVVETASVAGEPGGYYTNVIDSRAYNYASPLGFLMKVPFGNWYRNFGAINGAQTAIGVAKTPINTTADVQMWLKVLAKDQPAEGTTELITGDGVTLIKKRNNTSVFELTGPLSERDTLWSMADSIQ